MVRDVRNTYLEPQNVSKITLIGRCERLDSLTIQQSQLLRAHTLRRNSVLSFCSFINVFFVF